MWSEYNVVAHRHPLSDAIPFFGHWLDMPDAPLPGDLYTPRVHWGAVGPSERMIVSPGDEGSGMMHMPTGQSGHPLSRSTRIHMLLGPQESRHHFCQVKRCKVDAETVTRRLACALLRVFGRAGSSLRATSVWLRRLEPACDAMKCSARFSVRVQGCVSNQQRIPRHHDSVLCFSDGRGGGCQVPHLASRPWIGLPIQWSLTSGNRHAAAQFGSPSTQRSPNRFAIAAGRSISVDQAANRIWFAPAVRTDS